MTGTFEIGGDVAFERCKVGGEPENGDRLALVLKRNLGDPAAHRAPVAPHPRHDVLSHLAPCTGRELGERRLPVIRMDHVSEARGFEFIDRVAELGGQCGIGRDETPISGEDEHPVRASTEQCLESFAPDQTPDLFDGTLHGGHGSTLGPERPGAAELHPRAVHQHPDGHVRFAHAAHPPRLQWTRRSA